MPKAVFQDIYRDIRENIENGTYRYQSFLPAENELTQLYGCSRSSIRRALAMLAQDAYVLPQQGKGVRVIRNPAITDPRGYSGLETFGEMAKRLGFTPKTTVLKFEKVVAGDALAALTGFAVGSDLTHILRSRAADGVTVSTDESYYLSESVPGLTPEIVANSVYAYLEGTLGIKIATSRRIITVEGATPADEQIMDLDGFNAVCVMRSHTFDADGIMIEYTETRQKPEVFSSVETAVRPAR